MSPAPGTPSVPKINGKVSLSKDSVYRYNGQTPAKQASITEEADEEDETAGSNDSEPKKAGTSIMAMTSPLGAIFRMK